MNPNRIDHEGTLPQGKLLPHGKVEEAKAELSYDKSNNLLIIQFGGDIAWVGFYPNEAIDFANQIIGFANKMITKYKDPSK